MIKNFWSNLVARLTSRKFLLAIAGVAIPLLLDLSPEQLAAIETAIIAFIGAEGAKDFKESSSGGTRNVPQQ